MSLAKSIKDDTSQILKSNRYGLLKTGILIQVLKNNMYAVSIKLALK